MVFYLHVIAGPDKDKIFPLSNDYTVMFGRSKHANTRLADQSVSRVHCEVEVRKGRILLTDLESATGTFVNGKRVSEHLLKPNDVLRIGDTQMRVDQMQEVDVVPIAVPVERPPARPVLLTADKLHALNGTKLSHYEIGEPIAKGASGLIFKAHDFKNDRPVAFKVLWPEFAKDEDDMMRFIRAMKTMMPLRHPHLVTLYGAGKTGPYCWIAMELVEGESLAQHIQRLGSGGMLDWKRALHIAVALTRALTYAHGQHIIHRNLTPQNVLLGKGPDLIKLGDLMLAKAQEGSMAQQITKPGEMLGDVRFLAPEQTGTGETVDGRSDVYSLGALTYLMLTGRPPFEGSNLIETVLKIRRDAPVKPKAIQIAIPELFEGVVLKMLSKKPADRHQSSAELLAELTRVAKYQNVNLL